MRALSRTAFQLARDVGLFLTSARADARIRELRGRSDEAATFDRLYAEAPNNDPWSSADARYYYQRQKYDTLIGLLPQRRYRTALDLGCGLGLLTERLTRRAELVLGLDISREAIRLAAARTRRLRNVRFQVSDISEPDVAPDNCFDLVVAADVIYYLPPPLDDDRLDRIAARIARLLTPDGLLMVTNHYFPIPNAETRLTRRIHDAFDRSRALTRVAQHRQAFFLATLLRRTDTRGSSSP